MPATSTSASPDRVAGPSTGPAFASLRNVPPQCARDEELARALQLAVDNEVSIIFKLDLRLLMHSSGRASSSTVGTESRP